MCKYSSLLLFVFLSEPFFAQSVPAPAYNLAFSTYFGGSSDEFVRDVATDAQGNIYIAGGTASPNFPVTAGSYDTRQNGSMDVFVAKFTPAGALVWSTFIGGPNYDRAYSLEVDSTGVYVAGRAGAGFPTTANAVQRIFAGDNNPNANYGPQDGFMAKLSLDGRQLLWSTYIGDTGPGFFRDIALDGQGHIYGALTAVTGTVALVPLSGVYDSTLNGGVDGVVIKLDTNGVFAWATYFGGSGYDVGTPSIRADATGVYLLGLTDSTNIPTTTGLDRIYGGSSDMHLAKFSTDGKRLLWGTYIGGSAVEFSETHGLALDASGNLYVAVTSGSSGLATAGAFDTAFNGSGGTNCANYCHDGYIAKYSGSTGVRQAATYFGGTLGEGIEGVAVDGAGNVYVGGATFSANLPMAGGSFQTANRGNGDFFIAKFNNSLTQLLYSTYLGGSGVDFGRSLYADAAGNIYSVGHSTSGNFPTKNAFQPASASPGIDDGILVKFTPSANDTTPPSTPPNLHVVSASANGIVLGWSPSTDNVGVAGYRVFRGGVEIGTSPTNSYSDSGLTPSTIYTYSVSAYDAAGNDSARSAPVTTQTAKNDHKQHRP